MTKSVSRLLGEYEAATRAYEMIGSQPPECQGEIEQEYRTSLNALLVAISDLQSKAIVAPASETPVDKPKLFTFTCAFAAHNLMSKPVTDVYHVCLTPSLVKYIKLAGTTLTVTVAYPDLGTEHFVFDTPEQAKGVYDRLFGAINGDTMQLKASTLVRPNLETQAIACAMAQVFTKLPANCTPEEAYKLLVDPDEGEEVRITEFKITPHLQAVATDRASLSSLVLLVMDIFKHYAAGVKVVKVDVG